MGFPITKKNNTPRCCKLNGDVPIGSVLFGHLYLMNIIVNIS